MEYIEICPEGGEGIVIKNYHKKDILTKPKSSSAPIHHFWCNWIQIITFNKPLIFKK